MGPLQQRMTRVLAVLTLLVVPLLLAEWYFRVQAPGQTPGVYLETDRAYATTLLETDRALHTLEGYVAGAPGSSREAVTKSPVQVGGRRLAFFVVAPKGSALANAIASATVWAFVVAGSDDGFRERAVQVAATVTPINPEVYRVTSPELDNLWGADREAFRQYQQVLFRTSVPRQSLDVMIGLELREGTSGPARMYSVRVGPPR